ncbi:MAG: stage III sporulation protein AF [Clostridiales bacterium]|nr:stage III sporulation protein AF [Clostridiales bacterium]
MLGDFAKYIKDIAIFAVFAAFVLIVAPTERYKGFARLAIGFILIALTVGPAVSAFTGAGADSFLKRLADEAFLGSSAGVAEYDEARADMIIAEYKKGVAAQIKALVDRDGRFAFVSAEVSAVTEEEDFGRITSISVAVTESPISDAETPRPFIAVEPIEVGRVGAFSYSSAEDGEDPDVSALKKLLADFYNLSQDNINITTQRRISGNG